MDIKHLTILLVFGFLASVVIEAAEKQRPNILFIITDQESADALVPPARNLGQDRMYNVTSKRMFPP